VRVWLPPGYDTSTERYRVLYMNDGQALFEPSDAPDRNAWDVDRTLACLVAQSDVLPTLVVAIDNGEIDRAREFTPQAAIAALGEPLRRIIPRAGTGGATDSLSDPYVAVLVNRIKPRVDREFRTRPGRDDTVIMGSSTGGLMALYALCQQPQIFGAAACLSTHWPVTSNPQLLSPVVDARVAVIAEAMRVWLRDRLPRPGNHRFYFDHGTEGLDALYQSHQVKVDALMRSLGYRHHVDWTTRRFAGAAHNEQAWRERLDVPLRFVLREARTD
jgi:enterochelin esterase-like enzyme